MSALTIAQASLTKGSISSSFLDDLVSKEFINSELLDQIKGDKELSHYFEGLKKTRSSPKKKKKSSSTDSERNSEDFNCHRCSARIWKAEGGLGFDNIQCNSKNMVSQEEAEKILLSFEKVSENPDGLQEYLSSYDGCFCKKHLSMDFLMPNGYWLGKLTDPRPEEPNLPKGSVKKGFEEDFKSHKWMYDSDGNKVEKTRKKSPSKAKSPEEDEDAKMFALWKAEKAKEAEKGVTVAEEEVPKAEEEVTKAEEEAKKKAEEEEAKKKKAEEAKKKKAEEAKKKKEEEAKKKKAEEAAEAAAYAQWKADMAKKKDEDELLNEKVLAEDTLEMDHTVVSDDSDGEDTDENEFEDKKYVVDGVKYIQNWDPEDEKWVILHPMEYRVVGYPDGEGGINFKDEEEQSLHEKESE